MSFWMITAPVLGVFTTILLYMLVEVVFDDACDDDDDWRL